MIQALQYKICMMCIPIDGPTHMFCANEAVVRNSAMPESMLKKKQVAISYHPVQEACALGMIQISQEDGATNLTDVLTKHLPGSQLRECIG